MEKAKIESQQLDFSDYVFPKTVGKQVWRVRWSAYTKEKYVQIIRFRLIYKLHCNKNKSLNSYTRASIKRQRSKTLLSLYWLQDEIHQQKNDIVAYSQQARK